MLRGLICVGIGFLCLISTTVGDLTPTENQECYGMPAEANPPLNTTWVLDQNPDNNWRIYSWQHEAFSRFYRVLNGHPVPGWLLGLGGINCAISTQCQLETFILGPNPAFVNWTEALPNGNKVEKTCAVTGSTNIYNCSVNSQPTGYNGPIAFKKYQHIIVKTDNVSYVICVDCWGKDGVWTWFVAHRTNTVLTQQAREDIRDYLRDYLNVPNQLACNVINQGFDYCVN